MKRPLITVFVAATLFAPFAIAEQDETMNKRDLNALISNATTPQDHLKLADYYAQEVSRLTTEAQKHDEEAVTREKNPAYFAVKNPAVFGPQHCRYAASRLRKDAAKAQALAEEHGQAGAIPQDRQKLSAYYAREADRLTAEATKHEEQAASREKNPNYFTVKSPAVFGAQHCRDAASRLRQRAAKSEALAEQHELMGQETTK